MGMKKFTYFSTTYLLGLLLILLAGCTGGDPSGSIDITQKGEAIHMYIAVPSDTAKTQAQSRIGDPGTGSNESQKWDKLTIIAAYEKKTGSSDDYDDEPQKMVYWDTFSKTDFDQNVRMEHELSIIEAPTDEGIRYVTMYLPAGTVYLYGITYSDTEGFNLASAASNASTSSNSAASSSPIKLEDLLYALPEDGASHRAELDGILISNDYAASSSDPTDRFLSVATGYAIDTKQPGTPRLLTISKNNDQQEMKQYWAMRLSRLATKLDIQWDAAGAYETSSADPSKIVYTDVKVSDFTYNGGANLIGNANGTSNSGWGRLFPTLQESTTNAVGGTKTFYNRTEISKRNGRQYHYIYPDGSTKPSITFNLTTTREGEAAVSKDYTFNLQNVVPFKQAAWYKINATIKGQNTEGKTEIVIPSTSQN